VLYQTCILHHAVVCRVTTMGRRWVTMRGYTTMPLGGEEGEGWRLWMDQSVESADDPKYERGMRTNGIGGIGVGFLFERLWSRLRWVYCAENVTKVVSVLLNGPLLLVGVWFACFLALIHDFMASIIHLKPFDSWRLYIALGSWVTWTTQNDLIHFKHG
jgi:hypothetical protein